MNNDAIYSGLTEIFEMVFLSPPELTAATTANDVEDWDSINNVSLLIAVEEKFGVKFFTGEAEQTKNVGELVALIARKLNESR